MQAQISQSFSQAAPIINCVICENDCEIRGKELFQNLFCCSLRCYFFNHSFADSFFIKNKSCSYNSHIGFSESCFLLPDPEFFKNFMTFISNKIIGKSKFTMEVFFVSSQNPRLFPTVGNLLFPALNNYHSDYMLLQCR